jgi:hypothetical protein
MGAHHDGNLETVTAKIKAAIGKVKRGTVLCAGAGADLGKLILTAAGNEATAYGVLLDPEVDTAVAFSDGSVTGSVARAGTFRGPSLIVSMGINAVTLTDTLRKNGIFTEGPITVPLAAAAAEAEAEEDRSKRERGEDEAPEPPPVVYSA